MSPRARAAAARGGQAPATRWPVGCGVDVVEIDRFQRAVTRWGKAFLRRIFSDDELQRSGRRRDRILHLAAHFAAKEAVVKAVSQIDPSRPMLVSDVEVGNDALGRPFATVRGRGAMPPVFISITHTERVAVATAFVTTMAPTRTGRATRKRRA